MLAWGSNIDGELGDGLTATSLVPVAVKMAAGLRITAVQAGCHDSMALTVGGRVLTWGLNAFGELGDGTRANSDVPGYVRLPAGIRVTAIRAGCHFDLAVTSAGQV